MSIRIIIADDEPLQRMDLRDVLTRQGYLVVGEAADGWNTVKLAREQRPDVVVSDIRMPDLDGIGVAEILKQEKIAPVVLLTAFSDAGLVQRAKDAGVVNYLVKPLRESEIVFAVEMALICFQKLRNLEERNRLLSVELETQKIIERARGLFLETLRMTELEALRESLHARSRTQQPNVIDREVSQVLNEVACLQRGTLSIGASMPLDTPFLIGLIEQYKQLHPEIEVTISIASAGELLKKTLAHTIDLVFVAQEMHHPDVLNYKWHCNDQTILVARAKLLQLSKASQAFLRLLLQIDA